MSGTEELRETIVKALGIGVCTAQPCAHASCQWNLNGLDALDTLAQRTRDLAGEVERLRRIADAALDVIFGMHVSVDTTHVRVARNRMDALRAALAPAEAAGSERVEYGGSPRYPIRPAMPDSARALLAANLATHEPDEAGDGERLVTVCDNCLQASCWQGVFMCAEDKRGGTVEKPVSELQFMALESPHYWKPDA